jgi:hypothetical protein
MIEGHLRLNVSQNAKACFEVDEPSEVFAYAASNATPGLPIKVSLSLARFPSSKTDRRSSASSTTHGEIREPILRSAGESFTRFSTTSRLRLEIERVNRQAHALTVAFGTMAGSHLGWRATARLSF